MDRTMDGNISDKKWPTPLASSVLYLIVLGLMLASSMLFGGLESKNTNYYLLLFVLQFVIIALPPLVYMLYTRVDIKSTIRLNRLGIPEIFLIAGMAIFGYGVIIALNLVWYWLLSKIGTPQTPSLPPIETATQYFLAVIAIGVAPALFEELLFRGVIQRGYENRGLKLSIVLTGVLFALLHMNIVSLPAIIIMGILLCYIVYRSNSIWAGIIYHFINNTIAVTLTFVQSLLSNLFPMENAAESLADIPSEELMVGMIFWGVAGVFALGLFSACFAGFIAVTKGKQNVLAKSEEASSRASHTALFPAIAAVIIVIAFLIMEVMHMMKVGG